MQKKYLFGLGGFMIFIVLILAIISFDSFDPYAFQYTGKEMVEKVKDQPHLLTPQEYLDLKEKEDITLVDLRDPKLFAAYNIGGSENIPAKRVLDESLKSFFKNGTKKVLVDQNGLKANQIWLLLTQYGYEHLMVLEGGIDNWQSRVETTTLMKFTGFEDEKARVDYAKVMEGE